MEEEILISFTREELKELIEGYEEYLYDQNPMSNQVRKSLALKLNLFEPPDVLINRLLNTTKEHTVR